MLATFNSGFTMTDANGGYWQDGGSAAPLRPGAASMDLYMDGHLDVVRWTAPTPGPDVAAVRQNLGLLVDNGAITPDVDSPTSDRRQPHLRVALRPGSTQGRLAGLRRRFLHVGQDPGHHRA